MEGDGVDLLRLRTVPLAERLSKVSRDQFARSPSTPGWASEWLATLPRLLAGDDMRELVGALVTAAERRRPVIVAMGAHVVKCGLAPVLLELMDRGVVTAIATNGATIVHDVEVALAGRTSEDVAQALRDGSFGMAEETQRFANGAISGGVAAGRGLGEAVGQALLEVSAPNADVSLLAGAARRGVPVTVHVAIGTDVLHMHPSADGAALGEGSLRDFRRLTELMAGLGQGGVLLNVGSAVVLPEVILKALGILRNLGHDLTGFVSADLDFTRSYRGSRQVVERVQELGGRGLALTGHHEIMLPLIAALVLDRLPVVRSQFSVPSSQSTTNNQQPPSKLLERGEVAAAMATQRAAGRRIIFTNGCFDLLHVGHVRYLQQARALGDVLVVGVNSDASVRRLKGEERPLVPAAERSELLAALACVDHVVLFDEDTPEALITDVRPDAHVKGGDYRPEALPEAPLVRSLGGEVVILPFTPGHSTTGMLEKIASGERNGNSAA